MNFLILGIVIIIGIGVIIIFTRMQTISDELKKNEPIRMIQQEISQLRMEVTQNLQNTTGQVNIRLDKAAEVIRDVTKELSTLTQTTSTMIEIGKNISELQNLLKAPKFRGEFGETLLKNIITQILPGEYYATPYRFKNGEEVDAIIKLGDGIVPIDAKFPLSSFEKMVNSTTDKEYAHYRKEFIRDVKKHIDDIASKYIHPDEGTYDFAFIYIPAENVYYETIIKDDGGLFSYALERKIIPVSPNTFYAYLQVIIFGLRGLKIEEKAKEVIAKLAQLKNDTSNIIDIFNKARTQLKNAVNNFDEVAKGLEELEKDILSTSNITYFVK